MPENLLADPTNFGNVVKSEQGKRHQLASIWNAIPTAVRVLVLSILVVVPSVVLWRNRPTAVSDGASVAGTISSVAVLPITSRLNDPHVNAIAEGVTLNLTNDLARASGLRVPSQSTVLDLGKAPDIQLIRKQLKVDTIVNGTIASASGDSLLQMELIDVRTGFQIWGRSYTRKQMEEPVLAEDIAQEITYQIRMHNEERSVHKRGAPALERSCCRVGFCSGTKCTCRAHL